MLSYKHKLFMYPFRNAGHVYSTWAKINYRNWFPIKECWLKGNFQNSGFSLSTICWHVTVSLPSWTGSWRGAASPLEHSWFALEQVYITTWSAVLTPVCAWKGIKRVKMWICSMGENKFIIKSKNSRWACLISSWVQLGWRQVVAMWNCPTDENRIALVGII